MILKLSVVAANGKEPCVTIDIEDEQFATLPFDKLAVRYLEPAVSVLRNATMQYDISTDTHKPVQEEVVQSAAPAAAVPGPMSFNAALEVAKTGKKVAREAWKSNTQVTGATGFPHWLEFDERMLPHLKFMPGATVWDHRRDDLTAKDWVVVP